MTRMRWDRLARLALVMMTPCWMIACGSAGPQAVPAAGKVTYKGKPLPTGEIQFQPETDPDPDAAYPVIPAGTIKDGAFTMLTQAEGDGAPPGKYRVTVAAYATKKRRGEEVTEAIIPTRYAGPNTSGIVVEIPSGGKTDIAIDLTE